MHTCVAITNKTCIWKVHSSNLSQGTGNSLVPVASWESLTATAHSSLVHYESPVGKYLIHTVVTWAGCYQRHAAACLSADVMMCHCQNYSRVVLLLATSSPLGCCVEKSHARGHCLHPVIKHTYNVASIIWQVWIFVKKQFATVPLDRPRPNTRKENAAGHYQSQI